MNHSANSPKIFTFKGIQTGIIFMAIFAYKINPLSNRLADYFSVEQLIVSPLEMIKTFLFHLFLLELNSNFSKVTHTNKVAFTFMCTSMHALIHLVCEGVCACLSLVHRDLSSKFLCRFIPDEHELTHCGASIYSIVSTCT